MDVLKAEFLPEFLNRIDDTIIFRPLRMDDLTRRSSRSRSASWKASSSRPA